MRQYYYASQLIYLRWYKYDEGTLSVLTMVISFTFGYFSFGRFQKTHENISQIESQLILKVWYTTERENSKAK